MLPSARLLNTLHESSHQIFRTLLSSTIIIFVLYLRKLRLRGVKCFAQRLIDSNGLMQNSNGHQNPELTFLPTHLTSSLVIELGNWWWVLAASQARASCPHCHFPFFPPDSIYKLSPLSFPLVLQIPPDPSNLAKCRVPVSCSETYS